MSSMLKLTSLRFQYALEIKPVGGYFLLPIYMTQSYLDAKPYRDRILDLSSAPTDLKFHPVLKLLLGHAYIFCHLFDMRSNL